MKKTVPCVSSQYLTVYQEKSVPRLQQSNILCHVWIPRHIDKVIVQTRSPSIASSTRYINMAYYSPQSPLDSTLRLSVVEMWIHGRPVEDQHTSFRVCLMKSFICIIDIYGTFSECHILIEKLQLSVCKIDNAAVPMKFILKEDMENKPTKKLQKYVYLKSFILNAIPQCNFPSL